MLSNLVLALICGVFCWIMIFAIPNLFDTSTERALDPLEFIFGVCMVVFLVIVSGWGFFYFLSKLLSA